MTKDINLIEQAVSQDIISNEGSNFQNPFVAIGIAHATAAMQRIRQAIGDEVELPEDRA